MPRLPAGSHSHGDKITRHHQHNATRTSLARSMSAFIANDAGHARRASAGNNDTIDDMASALLDDTNNPCFPQLDQACPPHMHHGEPALKSKQSPSIPRKSSRRFSKATAEVQTLGHLEESPIEGQRRLPRSKTTMLAVNKRNKYALPHSPSVPLASAFLQNNGRLQASASSGMGGFEEINGKIFVMLNATNELKPGEVAMECEDPPMSAMSRFMNKVIPKVSSLSEKLQPSNWVKSSKLHHNLRGIALGDSEESFLNVRAAYPETSPITAMEIRLNEGENLNRKKVQKMVGAVIARKPVFDDGKSLRSHKSFDDPFAEHAYATRTPTQLKRCQKGKQTDSDSETIPPLPSDPFESEKVLESGIESPLSSTPLGWSTPRIMVDKYQTPPRTPTKTSLSLKAATMLGQDVDVDPKKRSISAEVRAKCKGGARRPEVNGLGLNPIEFGLGGTVDVDPPHCKKHPSPTKVDLDKMVKVLAQDTKCPGAVLEVEGIGCVKKHPSPSKLELEDLQKQMRLFIASQLDDAEADELAGSPSAGPLSRHSSKNRLERATSQNGGQTRDSSSSKRSSSEKRISQASSYHAHSRKLPKAVSQSRMTPTCLPKPAAAFELDELQWDTSAYNLGMRQVC